MKNKLNIAEQLKQKYHKCEEVRDFKEMIERSAQIYDAAGASSRGHPRAGPLSRARAGKRPCFFRPAWDKASAVAAKYL